MTAHGNIAVLAAATMAMIACSGVPAAITRTEAAPRDRATPVRIALIQDQTGSMSWSGTSALNAVDLQPLLALLEDRGGELALGLVREASDRGMPRIRIDARPAVTPPQGAAPENPFEKAEWEAAGSARRQEEVRIQNEWQRETESREREFLRTAEELLAKAARSNRSDVAGAIRRADLYLAEGDASWPKAPHRWMIAITDGLDSAGVRLDGLRSGARVVMVHGSGGDSLLGLEAQQFESVRAAIRHICAAEGR